MKEKTKQINIQNRKFARRGLDMVINCFSDWIVFSPKLVLVREQDFSQSQSA